jgi:hypothetical protein
MGGKPPEAGKSETPPPPDTGKPADAGKMKDKEDKGKDEKKPGK